MNKEEKIIKITEVKAATDQSIELLNEFQEKAKKNIIHSIVIDNNILKSVLLVFQDELIKDRVHLYARFTLNEKKYTIEKHIDKVVWNNAVKEEFKPYGHQAVFMAFHKIFSDILCKHMIAEDINLHKCFSKESNLQGSA